MADRLSFAPVRKAVIPIAGWGTRMFPASKAMPKALFPIIDRVRNRLLGVIPCSLVGFRRALSIRSFSVTLVHLYWYYYVSLNIILSSVILFYAQCRVLQDGFCKPIIQIIIEEALSALGPEGKVCIVVQDGQQGS